MRSPLFAFAISNYSEPLELPELKRHRGVGAEGSLLIGYSGSRCIQEVLDPAESQISFSADMDFGNLCQDFLSLRVGALHPTWEKVADLFVSSEKETMRKIDLAFFAFQIRLDVGGCAAANAGAAKIGHAVSFDKAGMTPHVETGVHLASRRNLNLCAC